MSKKSLNQRAGRRLYRIVTDPAAMPFTFDYNGTHYEGLKDLYARRHFEQSGVIEKMTASARLDAGMRVCVEAAYNSEFGETEYTVRFENTGKKTSGVLKNVTALDLRFEGEKPVLRGNLGDHQNYYAAYEHDLLKGNRYFRSDGGRATHIVFPYFDLCCGNGGVMLALGWAGTWNSLFSYVDGKGTRVRAQTDNNLETVLLPGESVRTGLIVMLPYKGRDYNNATNLWREWFMKYNLPKADGNGTPLRPLSSICFAGDTGLPNSDGSISERSFTWKPTLDKIIKEDVVPDFRWFDAGWYTDPYGKTVESDWWGTIGTWEVDPEKWPGNSFFESNEACHCVDMKVLMWFEPERVTHVDGLVQNYGYKEEWSIGTGNARTNDLGNPECLQWTLARICRTLDESGVDMYREDNNSDPGTAWPSRDKAESERLGLPRSGITENKCICGHYALWDGIIEHCRQTGKCTFVDSCASGGGRNDIESMRRGFPMMRSDFDRTSSSMRLSQSSTFPRWIPFHGSSTKETLGQLDEPAGEGTPTYVTRASFLPVYNYSAEFAHNPLIDYDLMRRNLNEWKRVRHLLTRDMYVLTPWHHEMDTEGWTALAYDAPEIGESILLAFRMENCEQAEKIFALPFAEAGRKYTFRNADTDEEREYDGAALKKGFRVVLDQPKSCALFYIRAGDTAGSRTNEPADAE